MEEQTSHSICVQSDIRKLRMVAYEGLKTIEKFKSPVLRVAVVAVKQEVPCLVISLEENWYFGKAMAKERWPLRSLQCRRFLASEC